MKPLALVTGGQRGIGRAIVHDLIAQGFRVIVLSLPNKSDPEVISLLAEYNADIDYFQHDMANIEAIPSLLKEIEQSIGAIDCFIANAGVAALVRDDILTLKSESWDFVLNINLRGTFFLAQAVAQSMIERDAHHFRSMIFITSVSAENASVERAEYCISKAGASMMVKLFATRLAPHDIGVYEVRPGIIATDMTAGVKEKYDRKIKEGLVPAQRWGYPEDVAKAVRPLALGQMAFAQGTVVSVDGGLSIDRL